MPIPWGVWAAMIGMQALGGLLSGMRKPQQPRLTEDEEQIKRFRAAMAEYRNASPRHGNISKDITKLAERYAGLYQSSTTPRGNIGGSPFGQLPGGSPGAEAPAQSDIELKKRLLAGGLEGSNG